MRSVVAMMALAVLTACGGIRDDLTERPDQIGNFLLAHNIVVANDPQKGPFSRDVTDEEWKEAIQSAVQDRLGRYEGDAWYHVAVVVQAYVAAMPGVPMVYSPQSVLLVDVTFFEDATQTKLNEDPIRLTIFEPCCTPVLGSGMLRTKEEQVEGLAFNVARAVERTMRENAEWFGGVPETLADDPTIVAGDAHNDAIDQIDANSTN
ncbi:hypothetical protein BVC71_06195 [Marivivens niveibacter]|uniref:Uncharacterized protein n=1 Tax=Marivivens niveibacter TaxID=1930667 RepID=A0A251WYJ2_9RHOB|nr:hypothetical protein [Marivivens niveibacter]OUD09442.1 hypothetical protein BVC71_06195 [Marivivens niveibacter]